MPTPGALVAAAAVGALAGSYASVWAMYEDSTHKGFCARRCVTRILIGVSVSIGLQSMLGLALPNAAAIVLLLGLTYAAEWALIAMWNAFAGEDRSKLFVPMVLDIAGVHMGIDRARTAVAVGYVALVGLFLIALGQLDPGAASPLTPFAGAVVGLGAGVLVAIGGAWKEATRSGFELVTFLRTPSLTILAAVGLSFFVDSYLYLAVAAVGYQRAVVETWKIFLAHIASRLRSAPWV